jgi:DNA-binding transcriptional ArsR family regulator
MPRRLGLSLRSVRYHVGLLADAGLVTPHRSGRFERFFPAGHYSPDDRALLSTLRVRGQRAILSCLSRGGPARFSSLQQVTGLSSATLARDLDRLSAERLVELGPDRRYRLCDPGATAMRLALYRGRFPDLLADAAVEIFDPQR